MESKKSNIFIQEMVLEVVIFDISTTLEEIHD